MLLSLYAERGQTLESLVRTNSCLQDISKWLHPKLYVLKLERRDRELLGKLQLFAKTYSMTSLIP